VKAFAGSLRATLGCPDLGLDLGTANTVVYERGAGVIVSEPSVVAYDANDVVIAIGHAAKEMEGRATGKIRVVRPLQRGTISDFRGAHALVGKMVNRALTSRRRIAPRLVTSVPGCATDIECKAIQTAVRAAGARSVIYLPQAIAAAVGGGMDITSIRAQMIVDIGGGTTEIAILAQAGIIRMASVRVAGDELDEAIRQKLRATRFLVGPLTAERLKIELGYAGRPPGRRPIMVNGMDLDAHAPRAREVPETLVGEAMLNGIDRIVRGVVSVIERTAPDVAADLIETGITLTGGGACITGIAHEIGMRTGLPTTVAPDPLFCVARGAGEILGSPTLLERLRPHADRLTRWYQSLRIGMRESYSP
jgi:rod shape-determining protein MreB